MHAHSTCDRTFWAASSLGDLGPESTGRRDGTTPRDLPPLLPTTMERRKVPADNNCLFTSLAYLCQGLTSEIELNVAARKLRGVCADVVLADEDPLTRAALLGMDSVQAYAEWIQNKNHWGGEPEVLMLAQVPMSPRHQHAAPPPHPSIRTAPFFPTAPPSSPPSLRQRPAAQRLPPRRQHFSVEIAVVSCETLSLLRYGESEAASESAYILYTGQARPY